MENVDNSGQPLKGMNFPRLFQVTDELASVVIAQLLFLQSESNKKPVHMYINSPGNVGFENLNY